MHGQGNYMPHYQQSLPPYSPYYQQSTPPPPQYVNPGDPSVAQRYLYPPPYFYPPPEAYMHLPLPNMYSQQNAQYPSYTPPLNALPHLHTQQPVHYDYFGPQDEFYGSGHGSHHATPPPPLPPESIGSNPCDLYDSFGDAYPPLSPPPVPPPLPQSPPPPSPKSYVLSVEASAVISRYLESDSFTDKTSHSTERVSAPSDKDVGPAQTLYDFPATDSRSNTTMVDSGLPFMEKSVGDLSPRPPEPSDLGTVLTIGVLCQHIARHGLDFEVATREKERLNPRFAFLFCGDEGGEAAIAHNYFQWMKRKCFMESSLHRESQKNNSMPRPPKIDSSVSLSDQREDEHHPAAKREMNMEDTIVWEISSDEDIGWDLPKGDDQIDQLSKVLEKEEDNNEPGEVEVLGQAKLSTNKPVDEDDDDDCLILDGDPDKPIQVANDATLNDSGSEEELSIVAEKGSLACRDYPHSRHMCAKFPFSTTLHARFCNMCHCYVCDTPAPCIYWGDGLSSGDHCHSTDKEDVWIIQRKSLKQKNEAQPPAQKLHETSLSTGLPLNNSGPAPHAHVSNTYSPCSSTDSYYYRRPNIIRIGNKQRPGLTMGRDRSPYNVKRSQRVPHSYNMTDNFIGRDKSGDSYLDPHFVSSHVNHRRVGPSEASLGSYQLSQGISYDQYSAEVQENYYTPVTSCNDILGDLQRH